MFSTRFWCVTAIIVAAAGSRLVPHPANFAPIAAMALFGGAHFARRSTAFLVPFAAMLLSDVVIGLHWELPFVYGCFAVNVLVGQWLKQRRTIAWVTLATLACSVLFYVATNFGTWLMQQGTYAKSLDGLVACYVAAIPFFERSLVGDLFFAAVMFGGFALVAKRVAALQEPSPITI